MVVKIQTVHEMKRKSNKTVMAFIVCATGLWGWNGCWEQTEHEYDTREIDTNADTSDSETAISTDSLTENDSATSTNVEKRNSVLSDDWAGFGSPCEAESECGGYPADNKRCIFNVMQLVDSPGGYCTACCDTPGENVCAPGVDCVGANNSFLICLERCASDADCRGEDNYICREGLYYMENDFPGKYCLPDSAHAQVPADEPYQNTTCPWPWTSE